jgi:hypothetical protein
MGSELVRYEDAVPVLTETVSDFATTVLHPLFGLGKLASRILAIRAETKRIKLEETRGRWEHQERMQAMHLQAHAFDQHSSRLHKENMKAVRMLERANEREAERAIRQIESNYDIALGSLKLEGAARRYEIDQGTAVALERIDAILRVDLLRLADARSRNDQMFALLHREARMAERANREIARHLNLASRQLSHPRFSPLAHETVQSLGHATALTIKYQGDGMAAVAEAISTANAKAIPATGRRRGRS